jgi:hypothetical protein
MRITLRNAGSRLMWVFPLVMAAQTAPNWTRQIPQTRLEPHHHFPRTGRFVRARSRKSWRVQIAGRGNPRMVKW